MNNFSKSIAAGLLTVFAGSIVSVSAQVAEGSHQGPVPFSDFDLDGDGIIVEVEFNEGHAKKMSEMAAQGHQMKHAGEMPGFSGVDTNGDGGISEQEFSEHQAAHHQQMQEHQ